MRSAPKRFEVEVVAPKDLQGSEVAIWRALQAAQPAFANPLFGPDFSRIVGRVRDDARVAVFRLRGEPVGFMPFHQRRFGFARPIGAPFSDYQALVSKRDIGLDGRDALRLAGIKAFRFNGLIDPHTVFEGSTLKTGEAHAVVLDRLPDVFLEEIRAASPKKFKNYRRLEHKLEREVGPLRLIPDDRSPDAYRRLMAWKSEQFHRTGLQDVLRPAWVQSLMRTIFETRNAPGGRGLMITLYAGDRLVAGHFGIRSDSVYHPWIASADPALHEYSPGHNFLAHAIRAMPELGLSVYDLGPGADHYKRPFANLTHAPSQGLVTAPGPGGVMAGAGESVYVATGLSGIGPVNKVCRRIDHILTLEPTVGGVLRGLGEAAGGLSKRSLGNQALSDAVA